MRSYRSSLDRQLATFLKTRMKSENLSFPEMGRRSGTTGATIHRLVNGERSATLVMVNTILTSWKVSAAEVFRE